MAENQQQKLERLRRELADAEAESAAEHEALRLTAAPPGGQSSRSNLVPPTAQTSKLPAAFHLPDIKGGMRSNSSSKLARQRSEANALTNELLSSAANREIAARERLAKLKARAQRELTRAASLAALEDQRERRRREVLQVKKRSDALVGRDVMQRAREVAPLGEEEVVQWSRLFNERLQAIAQRAGVLGKGEVRSFFQLFKELDIDGSRRISFFELERMVREKLKLPLKEMPMEKLYGLWRRLDENESGYIDAGELSRFMRIGAPKSLTPAQLAKNRLLEQRERAHAAARADADRRLAKDVAAKAAEVPKASREEILQFGGLFSRMLRHAATRGHDSLSYYSLFKQMDSDGSGRVRFDEFERMVRSALKCDAKSLPPPKLWGLWRAIDENENGFICAGEFQRFMRTAAEGAAPPRQAVAAEQKAREVREMAALRHEEQWARSTAKSSMEVAAAMEAEAARLEALLGAVATAPVRSRSSAQLGGGSGSGGSGGGASRCRSAADDAASGAGGEEVPEEIQLEASPSKSPAKRKELLTLLRREIKKGGSHSRMKPGARGAASVPLLRSFAKEEGQI